MSEETRIRKQDVSLVRVPASGMSLGLIDFDLFAIIRGKLVLFCRKGFELEHRHMATLQRLDVLFYVRQVEWNTFAEYAHDNLEAVLSDKSVDVVERSRLFTSYSRKRIKEILSDPIHPDVPKTAHRMATLMTSLLGSSPEAIISLFAMSTLDEYNVSHSINTGLLNILIGGICLGEDTNLLAKLGMTGIFHDIGKVNIDPQLITKNGSLTLAEFEKVKLHAIEGERILSKHPVEDDHIITARSHHERFDGSGYPDKLTSSRIPRFARITAVSDVYDALTSRRIYKDEVMPVDAIKLILSDRDKYDSGALNALLKVSLRSEQLIDRVVNRVEQGQEVIFEDVTSL
jgi:HD-GYP domain-containing protein (c-di-GMP phosphodiesterase class II)